jgi:uncharacterized protein (TIGR03437 family)
VIILPAKAGAEMIRMRLPGANPRTEIAAGRRLPGRSHYYLGPDQARWYTDLPHYESVSCREVYPGVDLVLYYTADGLEFDFVVKPGTTPSVIRLQFSNAVTAIRPEGDLLVTSLAGERMLLRKPALYQYAGGTRQVIEGRFLRRRDGEIGFRTGPFDRTRSLVIDPVLVYQTAMNFGSLNSSPSLVVDTEGNAYVTAAGTAGGYNTYVTKLGPDGSVLFSTKISTAIYSNAIAMDASGNLYVAGAAGSGFPTTPGAFQRNVAVVMDATVAKLAPDGKIIYATYLGGTKLDQAMDIAVDAAGNAVVVGRTLSPDFPVRNAAQANFGGGTCPAGGIADPCYDVFVTKLNAAGSALLFSTYLGGSGDETAGAIALDNTGNAFVAGSTTSTDFPVSAGALQKAIRGRTDAYVAKISLEGQLLFATYLGGSFSQIARDVTVDSAGRPTIVGYTASPDFPVSADALQKVYAGGGTDGFLTKLSADGKSLVYSSFLGAEGDDDVYAVALDSSGNAHLAGSTSSQNFPQVDAFQDRPSLSSYSSASFFSKLNTAGSALLLSTYFGGSLSDIAVDAGSNIYLTGPVFVAKFNPRFSIRLASVSPASVMQVNDATLTLAGTGFPPDSVARWNGSNLQTTYLSATALRASLPASMVPDHGTGTLTVWSPSAGGSSNPVTVTVSIPTPRLDSLDPPSVTPGSARFTLNLRGSQFIPTSYVMFGSTKKQPTFVNGNLLQMTVYADEVFTAKTIAVVVYNDPPDYSSYRNPYLGKFSNTLTFAVRNAPIVNPSGSVNAASFASQPIVAGSVVSVFGTNLASGVVTASGLPLPTALGGISVRMNGVAVPLFFVSPLQINLQVPWELTGQPQASLGVTADGIPGDAVIVNLAASAPGIFTMNQQGSGQGAVLIAESGEVASVAGSIKGRTARPVTRGSFVSIYCTGLGAVNNGPVTGAGATNIPLSPTVTVPSVAIGGESANVVFSGLAPGFVGLYQVNAQVPVSAPTGEAVPLVLTQNGVASNMVTIAVQ